MAKTTPSPQAATPPWKPAHHLTTLLYHGCLRQHATQMLAGGGQVKPSKGRPDADFGRGFYTTTLRRQAEEWAYVKHAAVSLGTRTHPNNHPVVVWFRVPREELATLDTLAFVRGEYNAEAYWSFVQHCRSAGAGVVPHHERNSAAGKGDWYDLACGPVTAFWGQRSAMLDADQFSFHTPRAAGVLNDLIGTGTNGTDYGVHNVTI